MTIRLKKKKHTLRWIIVIIILLLVVGAVVWGLTHYSTQQSHPIVEVVNTPSQPISIQSNTLFTGNTYWGRYMNEWSMKSELKTAYPFSRLNELQRDQYDAWITGLECPTVAGLHLTSAQEEATLTFNCSPDYLPEAAKWFTVAMLANNHTDNQGAAGFAETKQHLEENGIQYFGHYDPSLLQDVCEVIALPVRVAYDDESEVKGNIPVAMCGFHGVFKIPSQAALAVMEDYSKYMPVIAMTHMGAEYQATADQLRTTLYRSMIDHGADMVLGDHPHWVQTTESYKGKLIVYSMGNFIFDQQGNAEVTRSGTIRVLMNAAADSSQLDAWLALGDSCRVFQDDCLQRAQTEQLTKLPFTYQFAVVGTNSADKITKPATAAQQAAILERMNWGATMSQLLPPQSGL